MAQFRGTIQGQRGSASRLGGKGSGLRVACNGWHGGVTVQAEHVLTDHGSKAGEDRFHIFATSGSSGGSADGYLGYVDGRGVFHRARTSASPVYDIEAQDDGCAMCGAVGGCDCVP